jgi:hypothetical protein
MNDIGPEAKSLFEAARKAEGLPGPKRARIKQAVLVQVAALGAASTVAGGALAMSLAAKVTLVAVTAVALGGGSVSILAWKKHKDSAHTSRAVPTQARAGLPAAKPAVIDERPASEEPVPAPVEPPHRSPARAEPRRAPASPSSMTGITPAPMPLLRNVPSAGPESLDSELSVLRQAQEDLRLGLPAQALRRLAAFDRRFPRARLDQERQAIEAIAGCQVHPGPAALARAQRFLQHAPLSPLAARVRSACRAEESEGKSFNETSPHREP